MDSSLEGSLEVPGKAYCSVGEWTIHLMLQKAPCTGGSDDGPLDGRLIGRHLGRLAGGHLGHDRSKRSSPLASEPPQPVGAVSRESGGLLIWTGGHLGHHRSKRSSPLAAEPPQPVGAVRVKVVGSSLDRQHGHTSCIVHRDAVCEEKCTSGVF
jgi:hypothetical protein